MEHASLDRAPLEHPPLERIELVEPRRQQRLDRRGHCDGSIRGIANERDHFLDEERVAFRGVQDPDSEQFVGEGSVEQAEDELRGVSRGERLEQDRRGVQLASAPVRPPVEQLRSRHAEEQDRRVAAQVCNVVDEIEKEILAPVDVVEHDDEWRIPGDRLQQPPDGQRDLLDRSSHAPVAEHGLDCARRERIQLESLEPAFRLGSQQLLHHLDHGPVRDPFAVREASTAHHGHSVELLQELVDEARLPHSGRAEHGEEVARPVGDGLRQGGLQTSELAFPPDHRAGEATRPRLRVDLEETVRGDRCRLPLHLERLQRLHGDCVPDQHPGLRAQQDLTRLGGLLKSRRHVHRITRRKTLLGPRDDLAGVDADANLEGRAVVACQVVVETDQPVA